MGAAVGHRGPIDGDGVVRSVGGCRDGSLRHGGGHAYDVVSNIRVEPVDVLGADHQRHQPVGGLVVVQDGDGGLFVDSGNHAGGQVAEAQLEALPVVVNFVINGHEGNCLLGDSASKYHVIRDA